MVRKACPREELHLARSTLKSGGSSHGPSPTSALGGLSDAAGPLSNAPAAWQGRHIHPRGSCRLGPAPSYRPDPENP